MTEDELRAKLSEPFAAEDIKWRVQQAGESGSGPWVRVIAYVDNAAVMRRLDDVCGVGGWQNRFEQYAGGVICGISIMAPAGQWVTKWDGSAATQTEPFKGALSGAMKRAAVQWGIGRYLHGMGEQFAQVVTDRDQNFRSARRIKDKAYRWLPPKLDAKYLPAAAPKALAERHAAAAQIERTLRGTTADAIFDHPLTQRKVAARSLPLPGTKAHLNGHGGKDIGEVPVRDLPAVREMLEGRVAQGGKYQDQIDAIDIVLAEELGGGR